MPVVASQLAKAVLVKNYFYRVRIEAVRALINVRTQTRVPSLVRLTLSSALQR
jgi:hypothetical protein